MAAGRCRSCASPSWDRPGRHQEPGGRITRTTSAFASGEVSWPSSASSRRRTALSRLLAAVTIAGPVIVAAPSSQRSSGGPPACGGGAAGCRGPEAVARHSSHPARPSLPWIRRGATPGSRPEGRGGALNADPRASWRRPGDLAGRIPSNASCRFALIDSYQDPAVSTDVASPAAASRRLLSARTPGPPPYRSHRGTAGAARRRQRTRRLGRRRCGWRWPLPQRRRTSPEHGNAGERGQVTCR